MKFKFIRRIFNLEACLNYKFEAYIYTRFKWGRSIWILDVDIKNTRNIVWPKFYQQHYDLVSSLVSFVKFKYI